MGWLELIGTLVFCSDQIVPGFVVYYVNIPTLVVIRNTYVSVKSMCGLGSNPQCPQTFHRAFLVVYKRRAFAEVHTFMAF